MRAKNSGSVHVIFLDHRSFYFSVARPHGLPAESRKLDRVRIGYSSISGSRIALWATSWASLSITAISSAWTKKAEASSELCYGSLPSTFRGQV